MNCCDISTVPDCRECFLVEAAREAESEDGPEAGGKIFENFVVCFVWSLCFVGLQFCLILRALFAPVVELC